MEKTWKPKVVGILDIIVGCYCLTLGLSLLLSGIACSSFERNLGAYSYSSSVLVFMSAIAVPFFIVGILAIRGGIYALKRKKWGFALAGSIAALFLPCILWIAAIMAPIEDLKILLVLYITQPLLYLLLLLLGITAIIFTALSKSEFE
jgi:hypothetical protein